MTTVPACFTCKAPLTDPDPTTGRRECPECGLLTACAECEHEAHDDCLDPEGCEMTPETGRYCYVVECCCGLHS